MYNSTCVVHVTGHLFSFCSTKKEVIVMDREDLFFWISIISLIIQILEIIITINNNRDPNTVVNNIMNFY